MHLIIDIRSASPIDPMITRYASSWVDLWIDRHPTDRMSYIHYSHQDCPENGRSVVVSPSVWWRGDKRLSVRGIQEIFRCVNFSSYEPYDTSITTLSHIWDHTDILYPKSEKNFSQKWLRLKNKNHNKQNIIIVPSLSVGQEAVEINHVQEKDIEIIPYLTLPLIKGDRHTLSQLSISGPYWLYDGSYGSESGIYTLIRGYRDYRDSNGNHILILMGRLALTELRDVSLQIQQLSLTGFVRIIGTLDGEGQETLYMHASGWLYVGAYYAGGPRIELARSHHIPLLISDIASLSDYHEGATLIHPSHLGNLGQSLCDLENSGKNTLKRSLSNDIIMRKYEKLIAEKR
ncbi:hypothetical protein H7169_03145 [Candidatus Gracilibacteria bacterium]|nr:hypothetical protein [Candidatus Gracilibacteria bacterium]